MEWWEEREPKPMKVKEARRVVAKQMFEIKPKVAEPKLEAVELSRQEKIQTQYGQMRDAFVGSPAVKYLADRGISENVAWKSGCGYSGEWGHWEKQNEEWVLLARDRRVIFPIYDRQGSLVAISSRAIDSNHHGSKAITRGPKSQGVFATAGALKSEMLVITEAPIDALSLATAGFASIALIGTSWPDWLRFQGAFRKVAIATDADQAGDEAAVKLTNVLRGMGAVCHRLRPEGGKDWNELLIANGRIKFIEMMKLLLKSWL
jgi:DNA primase